MGKEIKLDSEYNFYVCSECDFTSDSPGVCLSCTDSILLKKKGSNGEDFKEKDLVNHPPHYRQLKGFEVIQITEQFNFNKGNALKYIMRSSFKGHEVEDLKKSVWYINREIERLTKKQ